jgi:hypothetical protein
MKKTLCLVIGLAASLAWGSSVNNDFGRYTGELTPLKPAELRERIEIDGDIYVTDKNGAAVLFRGPESRRWRFSAKGTIESNWSAALGHLPAIALHHEWTLGDDGVLRVKIQQYDSMTSDHEGEDSVHYGKLIKEETREVTDFAPVVWVAATTERLRLVVRFVPKIRDAQSVRAITDFPITGNQVLISDNQGRAWTELMEGISGNKYVAFVTHAGEIALSYYPFVGGKVMGKASGGTIELELDHGLKVEVTSATPFLPSDTVLPVYGYYNPSKKSPRVSSTHILSTDKEERFREFLKGR